MRHAVVAVALSTSLVLAGCAGNPGVARLQTAPVALAGPTAVAPAAAPLASSVALVASSALAPSVNLTHSSAPLAPVVPAPVVPVALPALPAFGVSTLRIVGEVAMTDEELGNDAEGEGYTLQASKIGKPFSKTGLVRETADGYALEASKSLFKKEKDSFKLTGSAEILAKLADQSNAKALIKGVVDGNNVVTVDTVKGVANLGFLTNWLTKGKISGTITDGVTFRPIADVKVAVKSADGYVFSAFSDDEGAFSVKSLTPGMYAVTLSKAGYETTSTAADAPAEVKKRTNLQFVGELSPVAAAAN